MPKRTITSTPAQALKAVLYDTATGDVWNTAGTPAFEGYSAGNITDYALTVTETSPGQYSTDVPATAPASAVGAPYKVIFYVQAGGSFATGDLANPAGTPDLFDWDGALPTINTGRQTWQGGWTINSASDSTVIDIQATGIGNTAVSIASNNGDGLDVYGPSYGIYVGGGVGLSVNSFTGDAVQLLAGGGNALNMDVQSGASPTVEISNADAGQPSVQLNTGIAVLSAHATLPAFYIHSTGSGNPAGKIESTHSDALQIISDSTHSGISFTTSRYGINIDAASAGVRITSADEGVSINSSGIGVTINTTGNNAHAIDLRTANTAAFGINIATAGDFSAGVQIDSSNSANAPGLFIISGNGSDFSPAVWLQSLGGTGPVLHVDGSFGSEAAPGIKVTSATGGDGIDVAGDVNGVFVTGANNLGIGISSHYNGVEIDTDNGGFGAGISITSDSVGVLVNSLTADAVNVSPGVNAIGLNINSSNLDGTAGIVVNGGSGSSALVLNGPDAAHDLVGHNGDLRVDFAATLLKLDLSTLSSPARKSLMNSLRSILNKWSITTGVRTVFAEDGTTPAFTETLTGTAGADPVTALTP